MRNLKISSSFITNVSYNETTKELTVSFKKDTYIYSNVPENIVNELENSSSQGNFYLNFIKGKYESIKL